MTDRFPDLIPQALDSSGDPINGARLFFYSFGTSTKKNTFSDSAKTVANANPVVADSAGRFGDIFMLIDEQYKVVLAPAGSDDPPSSPIKTWDNVSPSLNNPSAQIPVISKSSAYTVAVSDRGKLIEADASGGAFTVTLPAAATAANGFTIRIKKVDSSANAVTVDGDGAETIDGATTYALSTQYDFVDIVSDGTEWHIVGQTSTSQWVLIGTATASASATVDFSWAGATYQKVVLIVGNAIPATNDVDAYLRTSTDGGSTFDSGANNYGYSIEGTGHGGVAVNEQAQSNATQILMSETSVNNGVSNQASHGWSGVIEILTPTVAAVRAILIRANYYSAALEYMRFDGSGVRVSAADVDGVRFLFSSGNITSGEFACYGLK